jgi:hypothetical protein
MRKKIGLVILAIVLMTGLVSCTPTPKKSEDPLTRAIAYLMAKTEPVYGNEWTIISLIQADKTEYQDYITAYFTAVEETIKQDGQQQMAQLTDQARLLLTYQIAKREVVKINEVSLTDLLCHQLNSTQLAELPLNAVIFAALALKSTDATLTESLVQQLTSRQLADGGFSYSGKTADPDMTAMALAVLGQIPEMAESRDQAISALAAIQADDGTYLSWGISGSESISQVIIGLCAAGIDLDDERFVKKGINLEELLLQYQNDDGSFKHLATDSQGSVMATIQATTALSAIYVWENYHTSWYEGH